VLGRTHTPNPFAKAGALLHSLAGNHPLVDGNKRLAWLATYTFLARNGVSSIRTTTPLILRHRGRRRRHR